jgi:hypothetical protein
MERMAGIRCRRAACAMSSCCAIVFASQCGAQDFPRVLSGEEIQLQQQSEQWEAMADLNDGFRFRLTFFPDGRLAGTNVKGGGSMVGQWSVQLAEGRLCIRWRAPDWPPSACYKMVAMSQTVFDLVEPDTNKRIWHFKYLNF